MQLPIYSADLHVAHQQAKVKEKEMLVSQATGNCFH